VLPLIVDESKLLVFKFWFANATREGTCYHNDMFGRIGTFEIAERSKVYHLSCKLAAEDTAILLSCNRETCSIWVSLRSPRAEEMIQKSRGICLPGVPAEEEV